MKKTLAALSCAALIVAGCQQNSGQTSTSSGATPVAMTPVASTPADHAAHGGAATPGAHDSMKMGSSGIQALSRLQGKEFDIAFLSQMIVHHQGAVDMARQALSVATESETKEHAQKIIDSQTREIEQMRGWLKEWYQTEPVKEQEELMRQDMAHMMSMPVKDDHAFYDMMIPHHEGAIEMSRLAQERSARAELKQLAGQMIRDQQAEVDQFRRLSDEGHH